MKFKCLTWFLLALLAGQVSALENQIGGNAQVAALGFTQVGTGIFHPKKAWVNIDQSELFGIGLNYTNYEVGLNFSSKIQLEVGLEQIKDVDSLDPSGYGMKNMSLGITTSLAPKWQLGVIFKQEDFLLASEDIGSGKTVDVSLLTGPWEFSKAGFNLGIKVFNAQLGKREYTTGRVEVITSTVAYGVSIKQERLMFNCDYFEEEIRVGLAYQAAPNLTLRAGVSASQPTFGVGFQVRKLQFDYAYWLSEVGSATHRFGTSLSF